MSGADTSLAVDVTLRRSFDVRIGDKLIGRFDEESAWEGFSKLVDAKGRILIVTVEHTGRYSDWIRDALSNLGASKDTRYVLKGTPDLLHELKTAASVEAPNAAEQKAAPAVPETNVSEEAT